MLLVFILICDLITPMIFAPPISNIDELDDGILDPTNEEEYVSKNFTSCQEFVNDDKFDVSSIVNKDWKAFYFWSPMSCTSYIVRFSVPSETLLQRFHEVLKPQPPVNWTAAELFMESPYEDSALFIRMHSVKALYRLILANNEYNNEKVPLIQIGMKLVEPGYLAFMNCETRQANAFAPADNMPKSDDIGAAAAKFGIRNDFNYSYMETDMEVTPPPSATNLENRQDYRDDDDYFVWEVDPRKSTVL